VRATLPINSPGWGRGWGSLQAWQRGLVIGQRSGREGRGPSACNGGPGALGTKRCGAGATWQATKAVASRARSASTTPPQPGSRCITTRTAADPTPAQSSALVPFLLAGLLWCGGQGPILCGARQAGGALTRVRLIVGTGKRALGAAERVRSGLVAQAPAEVADCASRSAATRPLQPGPLAV
jgi:hypothetical protein